eukprot:1733399-Amphidinium_carterae.1
MQNTLIPVESRSVLHRSGQGRLRDWGNPRNQKQPNSWLAAFKSFTLDIRPRTKVVRQVLKIIEIVNGSWASFQVLRKEWNARHCAFPAIQKWASAAGSDTELLLKKHGMRLVDCTHFASDVQNQVQSVRLWTRQLESGHFLKSSSTAHTL